MYNTRKITDDLFYIGCSDRRLSLFESAYPIPNGISYNSFLLKDEKTVLFDTVDKACSEQFFENVTAVLDGQNLDYIFIHHMEPDHCAVLENISKKFPEAKIVCTAKSLSMIKQFFNFDIDSRVIQVKDGDTLNIGKHEFSFITAPMVHWPEVMVSYDKTDKALFSADAFGAFGAVNGNLLDSEVNWEHDYLDEARRYYTNIVGKYGAQVQMLLKKAAALDIKVIYPLHGLIIKDNIKLFIEKYDIWSKYEAEEKSVLIPYTSVYGGTENAVNILAGLLAERGIKNIKMYDVSQTHYSYILSDVFRYSHIVFATTTYNMGIFESMENLLNALSAHNVQNKKIVLMQNGSWAPACGGQMKTLIESWKNTEIIDDSICIKSALKEEQLSELKCVADKIAESLKN
ncbi:FprA family A-type flavoprotein [bacterium]|nr:FprA family A-type flavoprotein [bacterium]